MGLARVLDKEIKKLRRYIGKQVEVRVHIDEASWDYGECEHNEYNIEYKMKLQKINQDSINGIMAEDKLWRRKGEQITQLFKIEPESAEKRAPWDAGTIKTVILIKHLDEILYTR